MNNSQKTCGNCANYNQEKSNLKAHGFGMCLPDKTLEGSGKHTTKAAPCRNGKFIPIQKKETS